MIKSERYNSVNWGGYVYYDETSPTFLRWKVNRFSGGCTIRIMKFAGDVAGWIDSQGYPTLNFNGKGYKTHIIVWILENGVIPEGVDVDHINGITYDNNLSNLRTVPHAVNMRNQVKYQSNKTGITGVQLNTDSRGIQHYAATCCKIDGTQKRKTFSVKKYGKELAFDLACKAREEMMQTLSEHGAGYTDRHGT